MALLSPSFKREKREIDEKIRNKWSEIIAKYENIDLEHQGDIVDIKTGEIVEDNGHLQSLKSMPVLGFDATKSDSGLSDSSPRKRKHREVSIKFENGELIPTSAGSGRSSGSRKRFLKKRLRQSYRKSVSSDGAQVSPSKKLAAIFNKVTIEDSADNATSTNMSASSSADFEDEEAYYTSRDTLSDSDNDSGYLEDHESLFEDSQREVRTESSRNLVSELSFEIKDSDSDTETDFEESVQEIEQTAFDQGYEMNIDSRMLSDAEKMEKINIKFVRQEHENTHTVLEDSTSDSESGTNIDDVSKPITKSTDLAKLNKHIDKMFNM